MEKPFYEAIRKYGPENFKVVELEKTNNRFDAQRLEQKYIKAVPNEFLFNLSPGGLEDASFGGKIFWERLNANPEKRKIYLKKLSEVKKSRDWTAYGAMTKAAKKWRKENPKTAYKLACRALRVAAKTQKGNKVFKKDKIEQKLSKEKLMWKYKRAEITRRNTTKTWALRTAEEKDLIGKKISISLKKRMKDIAILPDFKQNEWPFAKATVLRKIRQGMGHKEIINNAVEIVRDKGSHWRQVEENLKRMEVST